MEPTEHILQFFAYEHLPPHLADVSKPFCDLAHAIVLGDNVPEAGTVTIGNPLPRNPERAVDYARKGLCHRAWLAEAFARDGWRVVLDGREWAPTPSAAP